MSELRYWVERQEIAGDETSWRKHHFNNRYAAAAFLRQIPRNLRGWWLIDR